MPSPVVCPPELRPAMRAMLAQLDAQRLTVGLVPAPEPRHCGHCVRMVLGSNPTWYQDLAAVYRRPLRRHRAPRYADPLFKRADITRALSRMLSVGSVSYLAGPLLAVAESLARREYAGEVPF